MKTGRSALHETVMLYQPNDLIGEGFIKNIQLLLEHGADAGLSVLTLYTTKPMAYRRSNSIFVGHNEWKNSSSHCR